MNTANASSTATTASRIHPLVATAAVAVTLFSVAGIAALTGILPMSKANAPAAPTQVSAAPTDAVPPAPTFSAPQATPIAQEPQSVVKTAEPVPVKPVAKPAAKPASKPMAKAPPVTPDPAPAMEVTQTTAASIPPTVTTPPAPPPCMSCGVVDNVREFAQEGEGSGLGAIAGGVIGGILGNQVGGGTGKKVATVLGAAGGAYAGHQVEKSQKKTTRYEISVRLNDGSIRTVTQDTVPAWRIGDRVRLENGGLVRNDS